MCFSNKHLIHYNKSHVKKLSSPIFHRNFMFSSNSITTKLDFITSVLGESSLFPFVRRNNFLVRMFDMGMHCLGRDRTLEGSPERLQGQPSVGGTMKQTLLSVTGKPTLDGLQESFQMIMQLQFIILRNISTGTLTERSLLKYASEFISSVISTFFSILQNRAFIKQPTKPQHSQKGKQISKETINHFQTYFPFLSYECF